MSKRIEVVGISSESKDPDSVEERIELSREEGMAIAPINVEGVYCKHLKDYFVEEGAIARRELEVLRERLKVLEQRIEYFDRETSNIHRRHMELSNTLREMKRGVLQRRGISPDQADRFVLKITPNGTVTHLVKREDV